ncbi:dihydroorotate dehydrogenase [Oceanidesulfovibrio indonesiensis]|uniref:Dihydroorotate dehydrogenase n=1 Tax=Oceanidesulfovibrio indonesiensis TaxID=54767 RepID=A0A7M3MAW1_9BACT|nr:dihydroorotate dehydrogenase [Oceanidesulfovibrio indonesiensis]TVM14669.1 dihydroorotate dehydrogenase [Oceanidesulfovibrio indonesiensis]
MASKTSTTPDTRVSLPGLAIKNPIMTASGTFGYGLEFASFGKLEDLGGIVVKGLSLKPRAGNPMERIAESPCGMLNAIGLQNIGVERFLEEKLPALPHEETAIVANLYACDAAEFGELAQALAADARLAALEVNVSCPNVAAGGQAFGQDPAQAAAVTRAVKDAAGSMPVIVKLSPNVADITMVARAVADAGADMLTCINTLLGMAVDLKTRRPRLANVVGGLSGPAIKPVALRCVWQVSQAVDIPVIGVGGISTAADVLEFILAGAHAVQIGTANFMRPDTVFHIVEELPALMSTYGVTHLDELRGTLQV